MKKLIMLICSVALLLGACSLNSADGDSPEGSGGSTRIQENPATSVSDLTLPPADEGSKAEPGDRNQNIDETSDNMGGENRDTPEGNQDRNVSTNPDSPGEVHGEPASQTPVEPDNTGSQASGDPVDDGSRSGAGTNGSAPVESILKGKIICIDPGHGNPEISIPNEKVAPGSEETKPGAAYGTRGVSTNIPEYMLNMEVSLKLRAALEAQGCIVVMTRKSNDENLGNIERAQIGNDAGSDLVIRVHADGSANKDVYGLSVLYPGDRYISDHALLEASKAAARYLHDAIVQAAGAKPRGIVRRDDLTGFNWTTRPTVLIEMGFMTNPEEDRLLNDPAYQDKIVEGIVNGLMDYFSASGE